MSLPALALAALAALASSGGVAPGTAISPCEPWCARYPLPDRAPFLPPLDGMNELVSQRFGSIHGEPWAPRWGGETRRFELPDRRPDPWLAEDKMKHFFMSFALTAYGYAAARVVGLEGRSALGTAALGAGAAGVWKEVYDLRTKGRFSTRDMVWNVAGIAAGAALLQAAR